MSNGRLGGHEASEAHIRVPPDLLNGGLVEMTRVADEASANGVGVLETVVDLGHEREFVALAQLVPRSLVSGVQVLDPRVMVGSRVLGDVWLEGDHVRVGNDLRLDGGEDGSSLAMDGANAEDGRRGHKHWHP